MNTWINSLTDEQKRKCGLLPEQIKARHTRSLAILKEQGQEKGELGRALKKAIR